MGSGASFYNARKTFSKESTPLDGEIKRGRPENVFDAEFRGKHIRRRGYRGALLKISGANL
jgi:hypothetical protein